MLRRSSRGSNGIDSMPYIRPCRQKLKKQWTSRRFPAAWVVYSCSTCFWRRGPASHLHEELGAELQATRSVLYLHHIELSCNQSQSTYCTYGVPRTYVQLGPMFWILIPEDWIGKAIHLHQCETDVSHENSPICCVNRLTQLPPLSLILSRFRKRKIMLLSELMACSGSPVSASVFSDFRLQRWNHSCRTITWLHAPTGHGGYPTRSLRDRYLLKDLLKYNRQSTANDHLMRLCYQLM